MNPVSAFDPAKFLVAVAAATVLTLGLVPRTACAQQAVFGNFVGTTNGVGTSMAGADRASVRFITGDAPGTVGSVQATLGRITATNSVFNLGIFANSGAGNPTGAALFSFGNRTVSETFGNAPDVLFAPGGSFTLQANTVYHLQGLLVSGGDISWLGTNPDPTPPSALNGSGIQFQAARFSVNSGSTWFDSSRQFRFQLNAPSVVPEPGTFALALPALGMVASASVGTVLVRRRKKQHRKSRGVGSAPAHCYVITLSACRGHTLLRNL